LFPHTQKAVFIADKNHSCQRIPFYYGAADFKNKEKMSEANA
jgi:hypothetical protein